MVGRGGLIGGLKKQAVLLREEHQLATIQQETGRDPGLDTKLKSLSRREIEPRFLRRTTRSLAFVLT